MGVLMRPFSLIVAILAAISCGPAGAQQDVKSANFYMPYCRDVALSNFSSNNMGESQGEHLFKMGMCVGTINGISYMSKSRICPPPAVTPEQATRVVLQYIDQRPAMMNENFGRLAFEALQSAWPCQR